MEPAPRSSVELPGDVELFELSIDRARTALEDAFTGAGTSPEEAHRLVDALVDAELCEVPTHGLLRVPWYLQSLRSGAVAPAGPPNVTRTATSVAVVDGAGAYGYLPTWRAVSEAITLAGETGLASVAVRRVAEFGRAAYYVAELARHGLVGIACQNTIPLVAAPGSSRATHGNNPLAFATPGEDGPVFDAAFTRRSGGELRRRAVLGLPLPLDWGYVDQAGEPTTDPARAAASVQQAVGGAKGFGLAVLVDLLAGVLTGSASSIDIEPNRAMMGALIVAFDPKAFGLAAGDVEQAMSRSAVAVRASGGRWPGDRSRDARTSGRERGTLLVPGPVLDLAGEQVGPALRASVVGVRPPSVGG